MTELELMFDLHKDADRQGPGSPEVTKLALKIAGLSHGAVKKIADIGCGTGGQTMTLARETEAGITAIDFSQTFLEKLTAESRAEGFSDRITPLKVSMDALPFAEEELDLIWSEGAIYSMGFENGVKSWRKFLRPGGCLAVSEICWITPSRPAEIEDFWVNEYPEIGDIAEKLKILDEAGYSPLGHFILPPECWRENYYRPLKTLHQPFLERHQEDPAAEDIVRSGLEESGLFDKYGDFYSYGFFIAEKR